MRLRHRTQRGGEIVHQGAPLPPGTVVRLRVDKKGFFEVPDPDLGRHLLRILGPDVIEVHHNQDKEV